MDYTSSPGHDLSERHEGAHFSQFAAYNDLPLACAVFSAVTDEDSGKIIDANFVYANKVYLRETSRSIERIIGRSYLEISGIPKNDWLAKFARALSEGETVGGTEYSPLVRDWVNYNLAPTDVPGCCVFAFVPIRDPQFREKIVAADALTSQIISDMLSTLTGERSTRVALNSMMEMMFSIIHPSWMCIFEAQGEKTLATYEVCGEGVESRIGTEFGVSGEGLKRWFKSLKGRSVILVPDVSMLTSFSKPLYEWCVENDVHSLMAAPFYNEGEVVGFLGAYNYHIDETVDINRLFEAVSSFIGARIDNTRLIEHLAWTGEHDSLTGLFNRRGAYQAANCLMEEKPELPCALALIDLDDFKRINDMHGHAAGDEALQKVARTMGEIFPDDAILCRSGGDEFLAVFSGETVQQIDGLLERFSQADLTFQYDGLNLRASASIGYATYPDQAGSASELYGRADAALYAVKLEGKAGVSRYAPDMETHYRSRLGYSSGAIVENTPFPLVVYSADAEGAVMFSSMQLARLVGCENLYDLVKLCGGRFANLVSPADIERVKGELEDHAAHGGHEPMQHGFSIVTVAGEPLPIKAITYHTEIDEMAPVFYTIIRSWGTSTLSSFPIRA